jgi:hypothetical protein
MAIRTATRRSGDVRTKPAGGAEGDDLDVQIEALDDRNGVAGGATMLAGTSEEPRRILTLLQWQCLTEIRLVT